MLFNPAADVISNGRAWLPSGMLRFDISASADWFLNVGY